MNIFQRIILILGAIALAMALWTTPQYVTLPHGMKIEHKKKSITEAVVPIDIGTAVARAIGVIGPTVLLFFAFKDIKKKEQ